MHTYIQYLPILVISYYIEVNKKQIKYEKM